MELAFESIARSNNILDSLAVAFIAQLVIYVCICGVVSLITSVLSNFSVIGSYIDERPLKKKQIENEVFSSAITCGVYAFYMVACFRLSYDSYPKSTTSAALNMVFFLLFYDFINYFTHRLLHVKAFRRFHRKHHSSIRVTTWSSSCLHPVEAMLNQIPFLLFVLITPVSSLMITVFYVSFMVGMASAHSNYNPASHLKGSNWLKRYFCFHQRHHKSGTVNFGFLGTHWDRVFGTQYNEPSARG